MTGDKLWGGKGSYFSLSQIKGLGNVDLLACVSQTKIKCHSNAPLMKKAKFIECYIK